MPPPTPRLRVKLSELNGIYLGSLFRISQSSTYLMSISISFIAFELHKAHGSGRRKAAIAHGDKTQFSAKATEVSILKCWELHTGSK